MSSFNELDLEEEPNLEEDFNPHEVSLEEDLMPWAQSSRRV
jgi:hypothetical protein